MPLAKLLGASTLDTMKVDEGNDSLDTFIRQAVGKEPLFSLSRTGDNPVQWIQFLHQLDQQDLPGWPLLAPKVQMQKCDKCAHEFCSPMNYRRHTRVHRRSLKFHKDPQKYRDLLGAFWDKLSYDEAKEFMSFKDVNLEEVPGSSIVMHITANLRKPAFLSLPQVYVKAGSALVDLIQDRPSRLPITSQELFSILDDASERTFLCAGTAESLQKYIFDGEAGKIGLEIKNLIACTSFLVEQKLVKASLADKDAEALRCQKLLFEEEEAAQKRQAELLERKRQRKLRQKEQRIRDQLKVDVYAASTEASSPQSSVEVDSCTPEENFSPPLEPTQLSNSENDIDVEAQGGSTSDHSDYATSQKTEYQKVHKNGLQRYVPRWQLSNSLKSKRNNFHVDHSLTRKYAHKQREQRVVGGSKVWTKKPKSEYGGGGIEKLRVQNDAINQTDQNNCQLMIGSISVTLRNSPGEPHKVNSPAEYQENGNTCQLAESTSREVLGGNTTSEIKAHQTQPNMSNYDSCKLNVNDESTNDSYSQMENGEKQEGVPFSVLAAKAFLAQRWKEAASGEHVKLLLSSCEPPIQPEPHNNHYSSESQERVILGNAENRLVNTGVVISPTHGNGNGNVKPHFRTKPEKGMKIKYIPKHRPAN